MFTGIITDVGEVIALEQRGDLNIRIKTSYDLAGVDIGASIACSGVCLTVVDKGTDWFSADVSDETLRVTTLKNWEKGTLVNLERSLKVGDELGGHIVTGHVDTVGEIVTFDDVGGSVLMEISVPQTIGRFIAKKGSVAIEGASLTVNEVVDTADSATVFSINLIPHTQDVTSFKTMKTGTEVNVEIDVLARYVSRLNNKD
ncbi:riboflavin synthase subunit alpha [Kordiimonas sediminis]|uniref:Riboflavin synthase n=1 Tax=Kordiimonas sediminis TaxID=1735581 RepID=A0A919EA33_9PROT|nr:riboflavin synthase [Kordiimonas sediminis]GHF29121.1 riboflavin synthase subunit alpha [Kordiimonas sediminis]